MVLSPRSVVATLVVVYAVWIAAVLLVHHTPFAFVHPGRHYVAAARRMGMKLPALPAAYGGTAANPSVYGYDGQFTYYMALHPATAKNLVDVPWYRYQRILEPLLARALAFGKATLVPWAMLALSMMAVVGGTWAMASWLAGRGRAPGWALLFGFWPGLTVTVWNDLTDGIAYGLIAVALVLLDSPKRSRPLLSALLAGAAIFARQEVAVYVVMIAVGLGVGVLGGQGPDRRYAVSAALKYATVAIAPFCIYLGFLSHWLGGVPAPISFPQSKPISEVIADLLIVSIPAVAALVAFAPRSFREWRSRQVWAWCTYGVHVVALTGFMVIGQAGVYYSWSFSTVCRYYIPVALGAVICYGCSPGLSRRRSMTLLSCFAVSMAAFPVILSRGL